MNLFRSTTTTPIARNSMNCSPLRRAFLLIPLVLAFFGLSPTARAQLPSPTPDGGYPNANTAEGHNALFSLTTGAGNTAVGTDALVSNTEGNFNTANGIVALTNNTTGSNNTATGAGALLSNTTISSDSGHDNTADGFIALASNTTGNDNTATGSQALLSNTSSNNTANGFRALKANTSGGNNTAIGESALLSNTMGGSNTGIGDEALFSNTTGSNNIALGIDAGEALTTGSNNIDIGNAGVADESTTIRIGTEGTQTATFIAGIAGVSESGTVSAVTINSSGQLGTAPVGMVIAPAVISSRRFKKDIKPMDKTSEVILALKPVTFRYKEERDSKGIPQFGLVAEDVEKVNPDLITRDSGGKPYTVRYDAVNAMLLNEFLKEHRKVEEQEATIAQLKSAVAKHETANAEQQKEIQALAAGLKEQAAQIQKVSAQLEVSKPAPQTVANNQ